MFSNKPGGCRPDIGMLFCSIFDLQPILYGWIVLGKVCPPVTFGAFNNQVQPNSLVFESEYEYTCISRYATNQQTKSVGLMMHGL